MKAAVVSNVSGQFSRWTGIVDKLHFFVHKPSKSSSPARCPHTRIPHEPLTRRTRMYYRRCYIILYLCIWYDSVSLCAWWVRFSCQQYNINIISVYIFSGRWQRLLPDFNKPLNYARDNNNYFYRNYSYLYTSVFFHRINIIIVIIIVAFTRIPKSTPTAHCLLTIHPRDYRSYRHCSTRAYMYSAASW